MTTASNLMPKPLLSDAPLGEVTTHGDTLQLVFHRRYAKPVEKVWAALTTPERMADWFAQAQVDLRVGGTIRLNWNNGAHQAEMTITVCEPPRALAWRWTIGERDTLVRFDLRPDGDGCALTLTHSGLSKDGARDGGVRAGWHAHLEGLPDAMDGHATPWEVKTAREAALAGAYPKLFGLTVIDDRLGEIRPTADGYDLVFERKLSQPVERVWAALTVPERISEWLLTRTEVDLRVGGRFALDWIDAAHSMVGEIVELDPPRVIAWTWPHEEHPDSVVRWELAPEEGGCRLTLTQTRMRRPHVLDVAAGWHAYLECLPGAAGDDITPWNAEREAAVFRRYEALAAA